MTEEKIWVECTCDYEGFADFIEYNAIPGIKFPICPVCGEHIDDIEEISSKEWKTKTNKLLNQGDEKK